MDGENQNQNVPNEQPAAPEPAPAAPEQPAAPAPEQPAPMEEHKPMDMGGEQKKGMRMGKGLMWAIVAIAVLVVVLLVL